MAEIALSRLPYASVLGLAFESLCPNSSAVSPSSPIRVYSFMHKAYHGCGLLLYRRTLHNVIATKAAPGTPQCRPEPRGTWGGVGLDHAKRRRIPPHMQE